jgi:hypothetical protein
MGSIYKSNVQRGLSRQPQKEDVLKVFYIETHSLKMELLNKMSYFKKFPYLNSKIEIILKLIDELESIKGI